MCDYYPIFIVIDGTEVELPSYICDKIFDSELNVFLNCFIEGFLEGQNYIEEHD